MGNQCSSPKDINVEEGSKAQSGTKPNVNGVDKVDGTKKETPGIIPAEAKEKKPENKEVKPSTSVQVSSAPPSEKKSETTKKPATGLTDVQVEVKVHPEQVQHQEKIEFAQNLVTDILTEARKIAVTQKQQNEADSTLPPFVVRLRQKKPNNFQQKMHDLLGHDISTEQPDNPIGYIHESSQDSINGKWSSKKPLLPSNSQKKQNRKDFATAIETIQESKEKTNLAGAEWPPAVPPEFVNAMMTTHKKCQDELQGSGMPIMEIHEVCQSELDGSGGSKGRNFSPSPSTRQETKEAFQNFVKDPNNLTSSEPKGAGGPPQVTPEQIEGIMTTHVAAQKLLLPKDPILNIHQMSQQSISGDKVQGQLILLSRSERENGKNFVRDIVTASKEEERAGMTSAPSGPPVRMEDLPSDFVQNMLNTHHAAQNLFMEEPEPRRIVDTTSSNEKIVDPAPLPPHLVRKALNDLKRIQLLAQESVGTVGNTQSRKTFKVEKVEEDSSSSSDDDDGNYAVVSPADRNGHASSSDDGNESPPPPREDLYARVNKPKKAEEPASRFGVSFADGRGNDDEERPFDELSLKRKKLMNRKQTGLFNHKDLELDNDEDEESSSDTESKSSTVEEVVTSPTSKLHSNPWISEDRRINGDVKKKNDEQVPSPTKSKLVGSLIARFEQSK